MIRLLIPTTRVSPQDARTLRWRNAVQEVRTHEIDNRTVMLVWETESPEVAYTQLNRLAAHLVPGFQVFSEAEEQAHLDRLGARYADANR